MSRDGSGTYERPVAPYTFDTVISEIDVNSEMDQIATALTFSIAKDGQTVPTANLPMGGYRHTGVAAALGQTDYARVDQVQKNTAQFLTSVGGTADAITATSAFGMTGLSIGMSFVFIPAASNTSTAPTININGIGAKTIKRSSASTILSVGDIIIGFPALIFYNGTDFILTNPYTIRTANVVDLSITTSKVADAAITTAKVADSAVTLGKLANLDQGKLIGRATASTGVPEAVGLGSGLSISGGNLLVTAASTTQSGIVELATNAEANAKSDTTRALTPSNLAGMRYRSAAISIVMNSSGAITHGLGTPPRAYRLVFKCLVANAIYIVGEEFIINFDVQDVSTSGFFISKPDAYSLRWQSGGGFRTGNGTVFTASQWEMYVEAEV
jgi:hypothetical protein